MKTFIGSKSNTANRPFSTLLFARFACAIFCSGLTALAASPPGDVVGKVIVGYQGWFSGYNDGSPNGNWSHYCNSGTPSATNCILVSWPDTREYTNLYQTAFANLGNGSPAKLFSPWDQSTVNIHFKWMLENDIDGAALQRFGSWITPGSTRKAQVDGIATRVMNAAQTYGRKFFIMYDCNATDAVTSDWRDTIVNTLHLTSSSAYAMQNGKPVVCLWGVTKSGRGTDADWINTINWFKNNGCYVIGGVLKAWTDYTVSHGAVYSSCNAIQPWVIGSVSTLTDCDNMYNNYILPGIAFCNAHGMDYQQTVAPGAGTNRIHGDLMWRQFYNAVRAPSQGIYISMFDEYNEGNQIAKTAENSSQVPTDATGPIAVPLNCDGTACWSDYYLRLTGDGGRMLKGQIALTPTRPTPPIGGVRFYQDVNYGGAVSQTLPKGTYTKAQLAARGMPNDWASSATLPAPGPWTVILYQDDNFSGNSWTITSSTPNFNSLSPSANDQVASVKIQ